MAKRLLLANHEFVIHLLVVDEGSTFGDHRIVVEGDISGDEVHDFLFRFRGKVFRVVDVVVVDSEGVDNHFRILSVDAAGTSSRPGVVLGVDEKQGTCGVGEEVVEDICQHGAVVGCVNPAVYRLQFAGVLTVLVDVEGGALQQGGVILKVHYGRAQFFGGLNAIGVDDTKVFMLEQVRKNLFEKLVGGGVE